jgi:hypothetical protein
MATKVTKKKKPAPKKAGELHGSCGCGSVTFTVKGPMSDVVWCHCGKCQRFHGGPGAYSSVPRGALVFQRRDGLTWWDASPTAQRGFCRQCGSSLFFSDSNEATVSVCPGALRPPTGLKSKSHIYVGSKPDWYQVKDGLPQHA